MVLLDRLDRYAKLYRDRVAFKNVSDKEDELTYGNLQIYSDRLADYLTDILEDDNTPILVYGHKNSMMLISFLACVKSCHPYCPVDISVPRERINDIVELSGSRLMIEVEECSIGSINKLSCKEIEDAVYIDRKIKRRKKIDGEDIFYIIFTSGSTGKPKGVQITASCLDNFLLWSSGLIENGKTGVNQNVFLNQALFSFDLSVMDVYTSLYTAGTIWALDKRLLEKIGDMYSQMQNSGVTVWVSTPSFVNMALKMNKKFNHSMLPDLHTFLFCGEILTNKTARELKKRFPEAVIINTYGPTESTVAVTQIIVNEEMMYSDQPLSIGRAKPGTNIYILDDDYLLPEKSDSEKGEIVICGDTVAKGYHNQPDLTKEKFFTLRTPEGDMPAYKTGDIGYKIGALLYYVGRKDHQLKINGYRIELEDIQNNILKMDGVLHCVVLPIEKRREGRVNGIAAFVSMQDKVREETEFVQELRKYLIERLPSYMIPQKYILLKEFPMTDNGKVDRSALMELL